MNKVFLRLKEDNPARIDGTDGYIPVAAENIKPSRLSQSSRDEILNIRLFCGNEEYSVSDFFEVDGEYGENIIIDGDLFYFKDIAKNMETGFIRVKGNTGMHTGAYMKGGRIQIDGDAGDWLGAEMTGGLIRISGNAGNYIGSAYRGDKLGMNRGVIIVEGNTGNFTGNQMRRGEIIVFGNTGDLPGAQMIAGSIYIFGKTGIRPGAGMKRGTIVTYSPVELLPTFSFNSSYRPGFLKIAYKLMNKRFDIKVEKDKKNGIYKRYTGDNTEMGKGEIYEWQG
ncbi:MAG: formylmethanofuran dehydrogenase subunit C [Bacillota bacterium]